MMKYEVMVRYNGETVEVQTNNYLVAWDIYRDMVQKYPTEADVDIISLETGEVFQSSHEW